MKSILLASVFALSLSPAFAEDAMKPDAMKPDAMAAEMKCDDASMMKVEADVGMMADAMHKEEAMKQVTMAKDAMKAGKTDDCTMYLKEAGMAAMKKM